MNKKIRNQKAITLIALVITIIILLILAGISILGLTGNNGLLAKVDEAKNKTADTESKEISILDEYESALEENMGICFAVSLFGSTKYNHWIDENTLYVNFNTDDIINKYNKMATSGNKKYEDFTDEEKKEFTQMTLIGKYETKNGKVYEGTEEELRDMAIEEFGFKSEDFDEKGVLVKVDDTRGYSLMKKFNYEEFISICVDLENCSKGILKKHNHDEIPDNVQELALIKAISQLFPGFDGTKEIFDKSLTPREILLTVMLNEKYDYNPITPKIYTEEGEKIDIVYDNKEHAYKLDLSNVSSDTIFIRTPYYEEKIVLE